MNRVQELIDEHKSEMPTMLAKQLLDACKEEYDCTTKLYRIVVTKVTSVTYTEYSDDEIEAHCKLQSSTQEVIVEPVEMSEVRQMKTCSTALLDKGMFCKSWLDLAFPHTICKGDDTVLIIHSIEPYVAKRRRSE